MKTYTEREMHVIIDQQGWDYTVCNNEPQQGLETIQVSKDYDSEHFAEFVGNSELGYNFKFYV